MSDPYLVNHILSGTAHVLRDPRAEEVLNRRRFLPAIAQAEVSFSIGMSEPDSGSDLASVATKAAPCTGGWSVSGRKFWTSGVANTVGADGLYPLITPICAALPLGPECALCGVDELGLPLVLRLAV
jgi:hypothetical protein